MADLNGGDDRIERLEKLALEEARRAVDGQSTALNELRSRSAMLTTSATLIVSFLGSQALKVSGWTVLSSLAVVAFLATLALVATIVWPRQEWWFRVDPNLLLDHFTIERDDGLSAERHLAKSLQDGAQINCDKLERLYLIFRVALISVGVQALLWSIQLSSSA